MRSPNRFPRLALAVLASLVVLTAGSSADDEHKPKHHQLVAIPGEDRFAPFALTIRAGDTVDWINNDTDDHTFVSDDAVNTAAPRGINVILPGTDSNGGQPAPRFPSRSTTRDSGSTSAASTRIWTRSISPTLRDPTAEYRTRRIRPRAIPPDRQVQLRNAHDGCDHNSASPPRRGRLGPAAALAQRVQSDRESGAL
jgi:plastocyanin